MMKHPTLVKILSFLRFLAPWPIMDYYAFRVWTSGQFDRNFYSGVNGALNPFYRAFPIRHYVRFGEELGWQPNPDFSPESYKRLNPDLDKPGVRPLLHFIRYGRKEGRLFKDVSAGPRADDVSIVDMRSLATLKPEVPQRFAIYGHIFYHDLWEEFASKLSRLDISFDLVITVARFGDQTDDLRAQIIEQFPSAKVIMMPNHGRDIYPFIHIVNSGLLSGYEAVCKIHTKKSPHRQDGDFCLLYTSPSPRDRG